MLRNYLRGVEGDMINTIMAAVAFNMMKRLRQGLLRKSDYSGIRLIINIIS
jgi:hypothetical protein